MTDIKTRTCNSCNGSRIRFLESIEAIKYAPGKEFRMLKCEDCELIFLDFKIGDKPLDAIYPKQYGPHMASSSSQKRISLTNDLRIKLQALYMRGGWNFYSAGNLITFLYNLFAYRSIIFHKGFGRLLDIGSGNGDYIKNCKHMGWDAQGVEAIAETGQQAISEGLDVRIGRFEEMAFKQDHFNVVTMWHVLEHFDNPHAVISKIKNILKPGGDLWIGLPNYDSIDRRLFGSYWNGYEIPLHLTFFTPKTLTDLLKKCGFSCQKTHFLVRPNDIAKSGYLFLRGNFSMKNEKLVQKVLSLLFLPLSFLAAFLRKSSIIVIQARN